MKYSTILLSVVYWLSDLFLGLWLGELVLIGMVTTPSLEILSAAEMDTIFSHAWRFGLGASAVLVASILIDIAGGRRSRGSFGWWALWLIRSTAIIGLVGVSLYSGGQLQMIVGSLDRTASTSISVESPLPATIDTTTHADSVISVPSPPTKTLTITTPPAVTSFSDAFHGWMWIQIVLGALILLVGATKQAAWRQSWRSDHEKVPRIEPAPTEKPADTDEGEIDTSAGESVQE